MWVWLSAYLHSNLYVFLIRIMDRSTLDHHRNSESTGRSFHPNIRLLSEHPRHRMRNLNPGPWVSSGFKHSQSITYPQSINTHKDIWIFLQSHTLASLCVCFLHAFEALLIINNLLSLQMVFSFLNNLKWTLNTTRRFDLRQILS